MSSIWEISDLLAFRYFIPDKFLLFLPSKKEGFNPSSSHRVAILSFGTGEFKTLFSEI